MTKQAQNAAGNRAGANWEANMATFKAGDVVVNFGQVAQVLAVDPLRGLLVKALPGQGFGRGRDRWHADPTLCQPQQPPTPDAPPVLGPRPEWAKAVIVAEFEEDQSDMQTDYFATRTTRTVPLAWSKHTRDLFPEMRKAAATFGPTAHLGPGKGVYTVQVVLDTDLPRVNGSAYWKGMRSHWHGDAQTFDTRAEADAFVAAQPQPEPISFDGVVAGFSWEVVETRIEHREKYSMGSGYYLKASSGYSTGWTVSKRTYDLDQFTK